MHYRYSPVLRVRVLIADGMMPDLDKVLDAVGQIRSEFHPKILEACRQAKIHTVRKTL
jgi:hypothetical protein